MPRRSLKVLILSLLLILSSASLFAVSSDYAYRQLTSKEQALYKKMGDCLLNQVSTLENVEVTREEALKVFESYLNDHPGIFWVNNGFTYTKVTKGSSVTYNLEFKYTHVGTLIKDQRKFMKLMDKFHGYIKKEKNDWLKLYHIYTYLASSVTYDNNYMDQSMWSVFFDGVGVCAGFARSFQYLALQEGIPCIVVTGYSLDENGRRSTTGHMWCMAQVDGSWYHFDPTWGVAEDEEKVDYSFFCRSNEVIELTHIISPLYPVPEATKDNLSYSRQRSRYFEKYKESSTTDAIEKAIKKKEEVITLEYGSAKELQKAKTALIDNQGIFQILNEQKKKTTGSINYSVKEQTNTITLYL